MAETSAPARRVTRFTVRDLFLLIVLVSVILAWISSEQRGEQRRRIQEQQVHYAQQELERARDQLRDQARPRDRDRNRSFWEADLEDSNLAGMTIASNQNAFQRASFKNCRLEDATLQGGTASFQVSRFDGAKLNRARLIGEAASFQMASFVGADLTGAALIGESASFQSATFEGATLIGATLSGNFQTANISGAKFEDADLSAIDASNLGSCYFNDPPTYNAHTKFPTGFNPAERLWRRVD